MIKVDKHDSIVDILKKMKQEKSEEIALDFPFGHPILHNYTSLKILKSKAGKKELIIATNDKTAKNIGKKLGIKYSLTSNPDLVGHNYNFWEYLLYTIKGYITKGLNRITNKGNKNPFSKYQQRYGSGKIGFFIAFLLLSIILLFFVFYFAVNRTYVYITPEIEAKTKGHNFIFKEMPEEASVIDDRVIKLKKIEKTVSLNETFGTSGIKADNISSAVGTVKLYNLLDEEVQLVRNTRLQSEEGLVFLLETEVTIPPADRSGAKVIPGEIEAETIARVKDINGKIIGKNGNISSGTAFILPGLTENKTKIYAISIEDFTGGKDDYIKILSDSDIENATAILKTKLEKKGLDEIKKIIKEENEINNVSFEILGAKGSVKYENYQVSGLDNIKVGEEIDDFKIFGTLQVVAYTYNEDILLGKINNIIQNTILDNVETVLNIDKNSVQMVHELSRNETSPFTTKQTVFADIYYIQNFNEDNANYVDRIKSSIAGRSLLDAEKILINNPKISKVKIKVRPFFLKNVSKFNDNIEFIIKDK